VDEMQWTRKERTVTERNSKDWRELCAAAAKEFDSQKLSSLVEQILQELDHCDRQVAARPVTAPYRPA